MNDRDQTHEYLLSFGNIQGLSAAGIAAAEDAADRAGIAAQATAAEVATMTNTESRTIIVEYLAPDGRSLWKERYISRNRWMVGQTFVAHYQTFKVISEIIEGDMYRVVVEPLCRRP